MKIKILIFSFALSLPLWWGINALSGSLENFWFNRELVKRPELFTVELNEKIINRELKDLKLDRKRRIGFQEASINTRAAISVRINRRGEEKVLFSLNSQDRVPIASITKLMTALVVFDNYDLTDSTKELIDVMLIESNNDAAEALAEVISHDAFVDLMNLYAKNIGLEDTYFVNPTGLEPDDPEKVKNYSTAEDLVKLTKYILKNQGEIFEITAIQTEENTNKLLKEVPEIIGGKTGWTNGAGGCLLLVLDDPNSSGYIINIVLGARDRFAEMRKILDIIQN